MRLVLMAHLSAEAVFVAASYQPVVGKVLYLPELQGGREAQQAATVQLERAAKSVT